MRNPPETMHVLSDDWVRLNERLNRTEVALRQTLTALEEIREACCSGMGSLPPSDVERGQAAIEQAEEALRPTAERATYARLITAAPDLLRCLKKLVVKKPRLGVNLDVFDEYDEAQAVIGKAEGR